MNAVIETLLVSALSILVTQFKSKVVEILTRCGDRLNDKIEGTATQLDDIAKTELVDGLKALIAELEVEGVDAAPGATA